MHKKLYALALVAMRDNIVRFIPGAVLAENEIIAQGLATDLVNKEFPQMVGWSNQQAVIMLISDDYIITAYERIQL